MNSIYRKRRYLTIIFLTLLIFSCNNTSEKTENSSQQNEQQTEVNMKQAELIEFGKKYAEAWSSQKPEKVAEFYASDGSLKVNDGEPAIGTNEITKVAIGFMDTFPDMIVTMDSLVTESNKTRFYWTLTGTNTGPDGTGNKVIISGFEEWTLNDDGLVQVSDGNFDEEEYNRQLKGDFSK